MITAELKNRKDVQKRLDKIYDALAGKMRPVMALIGEEIKSSIEENFEREGRPKWKPLSPVTIDRRRKDGHWPGPILRVRGWGGGLAGSIGATAHNDRVELKTNKAYATTMQFGAKKGQFGSYTTPKKGGGQSKPRPIPWGDIPARPFLPLEGSRVPFPWDEITDLISEFILRKGL